MAWKHPNNAVSVRDGKHLITLTPKEWGKLVEFVTADEIAPMTATPARARLVKVESD